MIMELLWKRLECQEHDRLHNYFYFKTNEGTDPTGSSVFEFNEVVDLFYSSFVVPYRVTDIFTILNELEGKTREERFRF